MNFNQHSWLVGKHAFLSASKYHWTNYSDDKFEATYLASLEAQRGTELHALAAEMIRLGVRPTRTRQTFNLYVNDAIGFGMSPEVVLYYSDDAFGTADAISFKKNLLRIHDLKTGKTPTSMTQLEIYAAFFCLEYMVKPGEIQMELRIYQNDDVTIHIPEVERIAHLMDRIKFLAKKIQTMKGGL